MKALCVSIHDVAPSTLDACRSIVDAIDALERAIPLTLLVVPCYHGDDVIPRDYVEWLDARRARGDELALHGYTHRDEAPVRRGPVERLRRRVYTAGEGEFSALDHDEAARRIAQGRRWFAERGWHADGFVAPAWLASHGTWEALRSGDFLYTTTLTEFHVLERGIVVRAPTLVYSARSAWRRNVSRAWNAALARACEGAPIVRFGFHPADARYPDIMQHALALLARLAAHRAPLTKRALARNLSRSE